MTSKTVAEETPVRFLDSPPSKKVPVDPQAVTTKDGVIVTSFPPGEPIRVVTVGKPQVTYDVKAKLHGSKYASLGSTTPIASGAMSLPVVRPLKAGALIFAMTPETGAATRYVHLDVRVPLPECPTSRSKPYFAIPGVLPFGDIHCVR